MGLRVIDGAIQKLLHGAEISYSCAYESGWIEIGKDFNRERQGVMVQG